MEIKYALDLSRYSEAELRSFVKDTIITGHEFINEMNRRKDEQLETMKKSQLGRMFFDENGKPYPR
jgi:hypothetical protein